MSLEDNLHHYDYTLHKYNISSKASRMFRVGFRVLLISSFADFSVAYGASQHKNLASQSAGDITPHTHTIQKKNAPLAQSGNETIAIHIRRNAPHLTRHVPLGGVGKSL